MKKAGIYLAVILAVFIFSNCKGEKEEIPHEHESHSQKEVEGKHDHHEAEHHHHDHEGAALKYGGKIGSHEVSVLQYGEFAPSKEIHFEIAFSGSPETPEAVRIWVGDESAQDSLKKTASIGNDPGEYHAAVEIPEKMPENSKLWIENQDSGGREKGGFELK